MNDLMLVTGGNGFIGQHAARYFRKNGLDVITCSRTFYGGDHRQIDLSDDDDVIFLFKYIKPKYILHLAGISTPKANGLDTLNANVQGTYNLLNRCNDGAKVIFASSVLVYGNGCLVSSTEQDNNNPQSIYAASKVAGEALVNVFTKQGKITSCIFRIPAVVGSRLTHGMLVDFLKKVRNEPVLRPIGEFPGPSKPYLHIDDLLSAFQLGLNLSGTYNVSPYDRLNVDDIAKLVLKELQIDIPIEWGTAKTWKGDLGLINVNSSKIQLAGWKNKYNSTEAIVQAIK